jgi:hypothetical protein
MKASSGRVLLRVTERLGVERSNYPVTVGVPFPAGVLGSVDKVWVLDPDGQEVPPRYDLLRPLQVVESDGR